MNKSKNITITQSIRRFRRRSTGSFLFVGFLAIAMILQISSASDKTAAEQIDLAGKQRMLAQYILTNAYAIHSSTNTREWDNLEPALDKLTTSLNELIEAHDKLIQESYATTNQDISTAFTNITPHLNQLVSSGTELNKLTKNIIRRAPYIDQSMPTRVSAEKNEIQASYDFFLPQMERITQLYQDQYQSHIKSNITKAEIAVIFLFIALIGTILFIIEPAILLIKTQLQDLNQAKIKAAKAEAIRWRLLTNIGHEFRTPMNAIMGFADLLHDDQVSPSEQQRLATSIHQASHELTELIEAMLDTSAIEAGQLKVGNSSCDLHAILLSASQKFENIAKSKNLDLKLTIDESCPKWITSDQRRISQIISNIVSNAIKFTKDGQVMIRASLIQSQSKPLIEIQIIDTGIGIAKQSLKDIFIPFHQIESQLTRSFGGAGLGLSTSKDIAKALGGDVSAESEENKGSTFTITIDPGEFKNESNETQSSTSNISAQTAIPVLFDNINILIVDDAKDNRVLLKHFLKKTNANLSFAANGQQALDEVKNALDNNSPIDVILMDMQMPVMDGYQATSTLRKMNISIPIIAITAHALEGDREDCLNAGCDEYLTKPVSRKLLTQSISHHLDQQAISKSAA